MHGRAANSEIQTDQGNCDEDGKPTQKMRHPRARDNVLGPRIRRDDIGIFCLQNEDRWNKKIKREHKKLPWVSIYLFRRQWSFNFFAFFSAFNFSSLFKIVIQDANRPIDFVLINDEANRHRELLATVIGTGVFVEQRTRDLVIVEKRFRQPCFRQIPVGARSDHALGFVNSDDLGRVQPPPIGQIAACPAAAALRLPRKRARTFSN